MSARILSLNTKLIVGCMVMLGFSLVMSTSLIFMYSSYYQRANRDVMLWSKLKRTLVAANLITFERGPATELFDSDPGSNPKAQAKLAGDRVDGDRALAAILQTSSGEFDLSADPEIVAAIAKAREALNTARVVIDAIIALPRAERSIEMLHQSFCDIFAAGDLLRPIAVATVAKIAARDPALVGQAIVAQMLSEMRDYAGRYALQIIPYVITKTPLPDAMLRDYIRIRERILTIWQFAGRLGGQFADNTELETLRLKVNSSFFSGGLQLIDLAVASGRATGDFGATAKDLGEQFVPTLQPMEQLRARFMDAALERLESERAYAYRLLIIVSTAAALVVAATLALIVAGRHYVLKPLMTASNHIVKLSLGEELDSLRSPTKSQEMLRLFDALEGLRVILGEREQHTERLKVLSETDGLTGLINRRMFDRLGDPDAEFDGLSNEVSVIMMDLDRFKGVNDTYGHLVGDLVLKHAAVLVQRVCRSSDLAARYGGEEFAIVIFRNDVWGAMHVAERIRTELEAESIILPDGRRLHMTASFGVAQGKRSGGGWLALVKAADNALYEAKAAGRNQVRRAVSSPPQPTRQVA